jgi:N-acetyl-gamma-glutamylphosphate reductase
MKVAILGASGTTGRSIIDGLLSSSELKFVRFVSAMQLGFSLPSH